MANAFGNPMILDGAFSTKFSAQSGAGPLRTPLFIDEIYWLSPATIADTFVFADGGGIVVRTGVCEVALQSQVFQMYGKPMSDFSLPTLASGKIYIYYH
jgi:hypothetical protein